MYVMWRYCYGKFLDVILDRCIVYYVRFVYNFCFFKFWMLCIFIIFYSFLKSFVLLEVEINYVYIIMIINYE